MKLKALALESLKPKFNPLTALAHKFSRFKSVHIHASKQRNSLIDGPDIYNNKSVFTVSESTVHFCRSPFMCSCEEGLGESLNQLMISNLALLFVVFQVTVHVASMAHNWQ